MATVSFEDGTRWSSRKRALALLGSMMVLATVAPGPAGAEDEIIDAQAAGEECQADTPENDDFRCSIGVSGEEGSISGSTVDAGEELGEPAHDPTSVCLGDFPEQRSVWYSWIAPQSGRFVFDTFGSSPTFDTVLAVYTGPTVEALVAVGRNDDHASRTTSAVEVNVLLDQHYHIAVSGAGNPCNTETGPFTLSWHPEAFDEVEDGARLPDSTPETIGDDPTGTIPGHNLHASQQSCEQTYTGDPGGANVWYEWQSPTNDFYTFYIEEADFDTNLSVFSGSLNWACATIDSHHFIAADNGEPLTAVSFHGLEGNLYRIMIDGDFINGCCADQGHFKLRWAPQIPLVSLNDASITEGNSGETGMAFRVSLSAPAAEPVTLDYQTADGTALAGSDYDPVSGSVSFARGETSKIVTVPVTGEATFEPDETLFLRIVNAENATILDPQGTGTIVNDDSVPNMTIGDVAKPEGNSSSDSFAFSVRLSNPTYETVAASYTTSDGSASSSSGDYRATSGRLTFAPGETAGSIVVPVTGDSLIEDDETFFVDLFDAAGAGVSDPRGAGIIRNDDLPGPALSINDVSAGEGSRGQTKFTFTVSVSQKATTNVTVGYASSDGTAVAGQDYTGKSGTATIKAGKTSATISISVTADKVKEPNETFSVVLSDPVGASIADGIGVGTIVNDD